MSDPDPRPDEDSDIIVHRIDLHEAKPSTPYFATVYTTFRGVEKLATESSRAKAVTCAVEEAKARHVRSWLRDGEGPYRRLDGLPRRVVRVLFVDGFVGSMEHTIAAFALSEAILVGPTVWADAYSAAWLSDYQPRWHVRRSNVTAVEIQQAFVDASTVAVGAPAPDRLATLSHSLGASPTAHWIVGNQIEVPLVVEDRETAAQAIDAVIEDALDARWPTVA